MAGGKPFCVNCGAEPYRRPDGIRLELCRECLAKADRATVVAILSARSAVIGGTQALRQPQWRDVAKNVADLIHAAREGR